jgi:ATP-dependent DNA helicase RecQ
MKGKRPQRATAAGGAFDEELFDRLRDLRKSLAAEQGVPAYVVFSDRTLHEMCRVFPTTESRMAGIIGVGAAKLLRYGDAFTAAVREFLKSHPEVVTAEADPDRPWLSGTGK